MPLPRMASKCCFGEKIAARKWRMCIYFTSLNRCGPKAFYPLPWIDQLVDSSTRYALLCYMDAFSGYHQIFMDPVHKEKTTFICSARMFCYVMMPFGLMNVGATYQRLMDRIFKYHIEEEI